MEASSSEAVLLGFFIVYLAVRKSDRSLAIWDQLGRGPH